MKYFVLGLICIALLLALVNGFELLFRLVYVLSALLLLSLLWAWHNLSNIEGKVAITGKTAQVGQWVDQKVEITNKSPIPKPWLEVQVKSELSASPQGIVLTLPGNRTKSWEFRLQCRRRGQFTIGPMTVIGRDPFGLFQRENHIAASHTLLVYPATVDLPLLASVPASLTGEGEAQLNPYYVSPHASGIRDYLPGDSFNRIHWLSSARTGRLMVKEYEPDTSNNIWLLVDMEEKVQKGEAEESTEEYGATIAASLAKKYLEANDPVGLLTQGQHLYMIEPQKGGAQLARIMEALAMVKAQGTVSLSKLLAAQGKRWGKENTLLIITPSTQESWIVGLRQLMLQGARVAVILIDASTFGDKGKPLPALNALTVGGIVTHLVKKGDILPPVLSNSNQGTAG